MKPDHPAGGARPSFEGPNQPSNTLHNPQAQNNNPSPVSPNSPSHPTVAAPAVPTAVQWRLVASGTAAKLDAALETWGLT